MNLTKKEKYVKNAKKISVTLLGISISYFGAALGALVNIGQGPLTAFFLMGSYVTGIQMGTVSILFQGIFIIGQLFIQKKDFKYVQLLQVVTIVFGGGILNFFLYGVFKYVIISSYLLRILLGICSYAINAIGVIMVLEADFVRVPLEGFLQLIAETKKEKLGRLKKAFDITLIVLNLTICFVTGFPITIREGTILNAFVFGTVLDFMKDPITRLYQKYRIA